MMALVGCLAYEFQVSLPVMASHGLHVGATGYGFMTAAMGVGAVVGGLLVAARGQTGLRPADARRGRPSGSRSRSRRSRRAWRVELIALAFVGGASISFMSTGNSTLQLDRRRRRCAVA